MNDHIRHLSEEIKKLDKTALIRPEIGGEWPRKMEIYLKYFLKIIDQINSIESTIHTPKKNELQSFLQKIYTELSGIKNLNEQEINKRAPQIFANFDVYLRDFTPHLSEILLPYLLQHKEEDIISESKELLKQVQQHTQLLETNILNKVEEGAKKILDNAMDRAEFIINRAKETSKGVSVEKAQEQFAEAVDIYKKKTWTWWILISFTVFIFGYFIYPTLFNKTDFLTKKGELIQWNWYIGYKIFIRIAIVGVFTTALGFCLKMLKANMHMREHNRHRKRIANSMISFSDSAISDEQRDLILTKLVEAVSDFGSSGILSKVPDNKSAISIDSITKTVSSLNGK